MPQTPNLLFILCDQMRFDAWSRWKPWLHTPNLDRLAQEGVCFDHAYCTAQACVPSRASLLTGRYAELHRSWQNQDRLAPPERTWAQVLEEQGYNCVAVGRTHHIDRGFETVRVPYGNSFPMIDYGNVHEVPWGERGIIETSPAALEDFYETRVADTAARLMEDLQRNKPFALYTGFIIPHPPFVLPEPFASMYDPADMPWDSEQNPEPQLLGGHKRYCPPAFDEHRQRLAMAYYFGMVSLLDHCVGVLLDALDQLQLQNNTLTVFTSDHGEQLGHRGLWNKCFAYDPSIRVPLLMRWPEQIPAGQVSSAMVELADVGPTLLEAMGQPELTHAGGRSFWEVARGVSEQHRDWIYSSHSQGRAAIYRDPQWKFGDWLLDNNQRLVELYDLTQDPGEQHNRALDADCADLIVALRDRLWQHQRRAMNEPQSALFPKAVQTPTFNAQFKLRTDQNEK